MNYAYIAANEPENFTFANLVNRENCLTGESLSHTTSWITQSAIPTNLLPNSGHASGMSCYTVL